MKLADVPKMTRHESSEKAEQMQRGEIQRRLRASEQEEETGMQSACRRSSV